MSIDFNVKEVNWETDDYDSSCLTLEFKGKHVNYLIINSLRKICIDQIPMYALHRDKIDIKRNNSVYDNTEMECRLSQLPLKRINHDVMFLPMKFYKNVNFADLKREKHPNDTQNIELYLNVKNNNSSGVKYVSTNDLRISVNNEVIESKKMYSGKKPITLIMLRPGEEFECSMKGVLATGELDGIFNASNAYYEQITENKFIFNIESSGQMNEYELLLRGIDIIIEKLKIIGENVNQNQYNMILTENNSVKLEIVNEDYTCGGVICNMLQDMETKVNYAGITIPNFIEKNISLIFVTNKKYKSIDVFNEAIDNSVKLYENIKKKIANISK